MGAIAGGINMITGRTEPLEPEQSYEEWLMEMLVTYGVGQINGVIPHYKYIAAMQTGHIEELPPNPDEVNPKFRLTPKAQRYLDMMNKENE